MTCKKCRVPMTELKGHIYHGNRKFLCPQCKRVKMQKPKRMMRRAYGRVRKLVKRLC